MTRRVRHLDAGWWDVALRLVFLLAVCSLLMPFILGPLLGLPIAVLSGVLAWLLATRVSLRRDPREGDWRPGSHPTGREQADG